MNCVGMKRVSKRHIAAAAATVAAMVLPAVSALAGTTGGSDQIFNISTTGATALGAFTRADGTKAIMNLGVPSLTIGGTTYTLDADGEAMGSTLKSTLAGLDRWAYFFHETGSVEGILELADGYGLTTSSLRPFDATSGNPVYISGNRFNATPELNDVTNTVTLTGVSQKNGYTLGRNYRNTAPGTSSLASQKPADQIKPAGNNAGTVFGQDLAKIAYSDVPSFQAFANPGAGSPLARPQDDPATGAVESVAGYGQARPQGNSNFQKLRDISSVVGGQANFKNESLAVVPFAVVANPGTGLAKLTDEDARWLHATGRLPNGANFNVVTRDPGSGTRNQGGNNLDLDPSWAMGERDRIIPSGTKSFTAQTPDGQTVTLLPGDEGRPLNLLDGGSSTLLKVEDRVGPNVHFSDKTSGSSRLTPMVLASRMAIGAHLSVGDVQSRSDAYADAAGKTRQLRVLGLDWAERAGEVVAGYVQPTAEDVTEGRYQMWSYSQAITVRASTDSASPLYNSIRPHTPGVHNTQYNAAQETELAAQHRLFLDNIINSAARFPDPLTNTTPADGIMSQGYILPQLMATQKAFDGAVQTARTRNAAEQNVWNIWKDDPSYGAKLDWADFTKFETQVPGYNPNAASGNQVKYDIYRRANTADSGSGNADATITVTQRVALAGDFNNDQVRDLADVAAMAKAYASPAAYLADVSVGGPDVAAAATHSLSRIGTSLGGSNVAGDAANAGKYGLIVLSDFNANGNLNAADSGVVAVERNDVRWFLYGAAIDTGAGTAKARREDGVRTGQLKKNQAIDTFNGTLNGFVGTMANPATGANYTQAEIDAMKFEKRDVDGSGSRAFASGDMKFLDDALLVDRFAGKSYRNLTDQLSAVAPRTFMLHPDDAALNGGSLYRTVDVAFSLVDAELNDSPDGMIDNADMAVMNQALTTNAAVNPAGQVDHDWAPVTTKSGSTHIVLAPAAGTFTLPAGGATLNINAGSFTVGGAAKPFVDQANPGRKMTVNVNGGTLVLNSNVGAPAAAAEASAGTPAIANVSIDIAAGSAVLGASQDVELIMSSVADGIDIHGFALRVHGLMTEMSLNNLVRGGFVDDLTIAGGQRVGVGLKTDALGFGFILLQKTLQGDADMDGDVDLGDVDKWIRNFTGTIDDPANPTKMWSQGDWDLDGDVDLGDVDKWIRNFTGTIDAGLPMYVEHANPQAVAALQGLGLNVVAVPEPGSLALLGLGAAGLMGRRRRTN